MRRLFSSCHALTVIDAFNFPLQSVESVTPIDDFTLLVGLDNN